MNDHAKTPKETEADVIEQAEKLEEIFSAEGIFGEVIKEEDLGDLAGGARPTLPPVCSGHRWWVR